MALPDDKQEGKPLWSLQEDVKAAVEYAEGQIRRLLGGQVELWELPLTGGLWRVTGVSSNLNCLNIQSLQPWLASPESISCHFMSA